MRSLLEEHYLLLILPFHVSKLKMRLKIKYKNVWLWCSVLNVLKSSRLKTWMMLCHIHLTRWLWKSLLSDTFSLQCLSFLAEVSDNMPYFFFPPKNVIYEVYPKIKIVFILLTLVSFQTCMSSVEQKGTYFGEKVCFFLFLY